MAHTSLIEQSQSKKFASADMEMSFNILEILSYFHHFYSQLLFKQSKKTHQISVSVNLKKPIKLAYQSNFFHFFFETWKTGYSEGETDSKVLPTIIYNSHL